MKRGQGDLKAPASMLERLLRRTVDRDLAEAAWGDLEEQAAEIARRFGPWISRTWLWFQAGRLILDLGDLRRLTGKEAGMDKWSDRTRRMAALAGALAAIPAEILVLSGLLYTLSGSPRVVEALDATVFAPDGFLFRVVLHPAVIMGGLALAVGLNLLPLLRARIERGPGDLRGTIAVRLRGPHLVIGALGMTLLAAILAYGFTENFEIVARHPAPEGQAAVAAGAGWTAVRGSDGEWTVRTLQGVPTEAVISSLRCGWTRTFVPPASNGRLEEFRLETLRQPVHWADCTPVTEVN